MNPEKFGRYEIKKELGRGGMGMVYHAYDPVFDREVALKVLPRELLQNTELRSRFQREARVIAKLEHPNVVPVYDFGTENSQPFLVMRFMAGGSLESLLANGKTLGLSETAAILRRLASGMDYFHQRGIIHRDMKPDNVLFDDAGNPYIADFGIAKLEEVTTSLTSVNAVIGTLQYMSPEQMQGGQVVDHRTDIYALGAILFRMLTGYPPYRGTQQQVVIMTLTAPIPKLQETNSQIPIEVQWIIEKALAKNKEDRYASAGGLAQAFVEIVEANLQVKLGVGVIAGPKASDQKVPTLLPSNFETINASVSSNRSDNYTTPSRKRPLWIWIPVGIFVSLILLFIVVGLVAMNFRPSPTPTPTITSTSAVESLPLEITPTPSLTNTPTLPPSSTPTRTDTSTPTLAPSLTPTPTFTPTPSVTIQSIAPTSIPTLKPTAKPDPPTSPPEPTAADPPSATPAQP